MGTLQKILTITVGVCISSAAYSTEIVFDQQLAVSHCTDKWTKRGVLDGDMFSYCMDQQTDGYAEALHLQNKYTNIEKVELIDEVVAFALNKWGKRKEYQMDMVAYEIEGQGEAYLNVAYEVSTGNVSSQQLNDCKAKWLRPNKPQWDMVEYCLND